MLDPVQNPVVGHSERSHDSKRTSDDLEELKTLKH